MTRKPLWMRLWHRYYNWRQNMLFKMGICTRCGWNRTHHVGDGLCEQCWIETWPW